MKWRIVVGKFGSGGRTIKGSTGALEVTGKPGTLLEWVEAQLGLNGPSLPWTDRVVAYHQALGRQTGRKGATRLSGGALQTACRTIRTTVIAGQVAPPLRQPFR